MSNEVNILISMTHESSLRQDSEGYDPFGQWSGDKTISGLSLNFKIFTMKYQSPGATHDR